MTPYEAFHENGQDINLLLRFHREKTGGTAGRPTGVEVLNKSAVVLLAACWEAFVEDVATEAFDFLVAEAAEPRDLPKSLFKAVAKELRADKNESRVWDLAGDGWRSVLALYRDKVIESEVGTLNTPRAANVDRLFSRLIGLEDISKGWKWSGMNAKSSKDKLSKFIKVRGSIAHRVSAEKGVTKKFALGHATFIIRLAVRTNNDVAAHIKKETGKQIWEKRTYKATS